MATSIAVVATSGHRNGPPPGAAPALVFAKLVAGSVIATSEAVRKRLGTECCLCAADNIGKADAKVVTDHNDFTPGYGLIVHQDVHWLS